MAYRNRKPYFLFMVENRFHLVYARRSVCRGQCGINYISNDIIGIFRCRKKKQFQKKKKPKLRSIRYILHEQIFSMWPLHRSCAGRVQHAPILFQCMESTRKIQCLWMCGEINFIESKLWPFSEANFSPLLYISCVRITIPKLFFIAPLLLRSTDI